MTFRIVFWLLAFLVYAVQAQSLVVEPQWLKANLGNSKLVVLDVRSEKDYIKGHIPGSSRVTWQEFTEPPIAGAAFNGNLRPWTWIHQRLGNLGIDNHSTVIVVGLAQKGWGEEGYILWILRAAGLAPSALLNGGFEYWEQNGYPTTRAVVAPIKRTLHAIPDSSWQITSADIRKASKLVLADSRTWLEYRGIPLHGEARGGHIPGAVHFPVQQIYAQDGRLLSPKELAIRFKSSFPSSQMPVASYCTAGVRSAMLTIALRYAGYRNARNYGPSMTEWASHPDFPMEKF